LIVFAFAGDSTITNRLPLALDVELSAVCFDEVAFDFFVSDVEELFFVAISR
jgi:hypothetical protein